MSSENINKQLAEIKQLLLAQQPRPFTLPEAAKYLAISKSRLYTLISKNRISYYKPSKRVFFQKKDLDAYLLRNRSASIDEIAAELERGGRDADADR